MGSSDDDDVRTVASKVPEMEGVRGRGEISHSLHWLAVSGS